MNGDLSKINETLKENVPTMIMHLREEDVRIDNSTDMAQMKCLGKLLSISNFIKSVGTLATQI